MKRREFIAYSSAAVAALYSLRLTAAINGPRSIAVVRDERFSDSRRFAEYFAARGATVVSLQEDLGRSWRGPLAALCSQANTRIVGLTQHTELMISQLSAREFGAKLVYEGRHECRGQSTVTHLLPTSPRQSALSLDCEWPSAMAAMIASVDAREAPAACPTTCQTTGPTTCKVATSAPRAADHPGTLFSWLIASRLIASPQAADPSILLR